MFLLSILHDGEIDDTSSQGILILDSQLHPFHLRYASDDAALHRDSVQTNLPKSLSNLLETAVGFPPALVGACRKMKLIQTNDLEYFNSVFEGHLIELLESQKKSPACLLRSSIYEPGYRDLGEFLWVIRFDESKVGKEVTWISYDFQVYQDDVASFDVDPIWLSNRFQPDQLGNHDRLLK
jgi:hypothetical protein